MKKIQIGKILLSSLHYYQEGCKNKWVKGKKGGAWLTPWVEHVTLDLKVLSSSLTMGVKHTLKKKG